MCMEKHVVVKKKCLQMFCHYEPVEKSVYGVKTHWLSCKEKVLGAVVSKEGDADVSSGTWKHS